MRVILTGQGIDDGRSRPPCSCCRLLLPPRSDWLTVEEATRDMVEAHAVRITDALSGKASSSVSTTAPT